MFHFQFLCVFQYPVRITNKKSNYLSLIKCTNYWVVSLTVTGNYDVKLVYKSSNQFFDEGICFGFLIFVKF